MADLSLARICLSSECHAAWAPVAPPPGTAGGNERMAEDLQSAVQYAVLHEFVDPARQRLPRGTWDYLVGGAETETTQERNRIALDSLAFRPRVLRDVE